MGIYIGMPAKKPIKLLGSDSTKRLRKKRAKHIARLLSECSISATRIADVFRDIVKMAKQSAEELAC